MSVYESDWIFLLDSEKNIVPLYVTQGADMVLKNPTIDHRTATGFSVSEKGRTEPDNIRLDVIFIDPENIPFIKDNTSAYTKEKQIEKLLSFRNNNTVFKVVANRIKKYTHDKMIITDIRFNVSTTIMDAYSATIDMKEIIETKTGVYGDIPLSLVTPAAVEEEGIEGSNNYKYHCGCEIYFEKDDIVLSKAMFERLLEEADNKKFSGLTLTDLDPSEYVIDIPWYLLPVVGEKAKVERIQELLSLPYSIFDEDPYAYNDTLPCVFKFSIPSSRRKYETKTEEKLSDSKNVVVNSNNYTYVIDNMFESEEHESITLNYTLWLYIGGTDRKHLCGLLTWDDSLNGSPQSFDFDDFLNYDNLLDSGGALVPGRVYMISGDETSVSSDCDFMFSVWGIPDLTTSYTFGEDEKADYQTNFRRVESSDVEGEYKAYEGERRNGDPIKCAIVRRTKWRDTGKRVKTWFEVVRPGVRYIELVE